MDSVPIDETHFLSEVGYSSTPAQELGHQTVNPLILEFSRSLSEGFYSGILFNFAKVPVPFSWLALPSLVAVDTYVSDSSKQLSYDHEYAREVWEHEHNRNGEIDEYVTYATSRGVSPTKAREIARSVTVETGVSVPYHLAFELGITEPILYNRKLTHAAAVGVGYSGGMILSFLAGRVGKSLFTNHGVFSRCFATAGIYLMLISPVLFFRYKNLSRVAGSTRFKVTAAGAYFTVLCIVCYMSRRA